MKLESSQPAGTFSSRSLVELRYSLPPRDVSSRDGGLKTKLLLFMHTRGLHFIGRDTTDDHNVITAYLLPEHAGIIIDWLSQNGLSPSP